MWVGRVAARTPPSTGVALTLYSLGVRGQSTEDVVVRMPLEVSPRFARGDEHGVVLAVGMADAFATVPSRGRPPRWSSDSRPADVRRLVVGAPPVGPPEVRERLAALDTAFARVCERLDVPYVSTYAPLVGHGRGSASGSPTACTRGRPATGCSRS